MSRLTRIRTWWHAIFHGTRISSEVEAELQFHIDSYAADLAQRGIPPEQAARQARIKLGRACVQKEKYREAIGLRPFDEIGADVRYCLRSLWKNPGFSAVAILSLALGIGATTAMFSLIYAVLLHPFPYAGADRIVNPVVSNEKHPEIWFALTSSQFDSFRKAKSIDSILGFHLANLETTDSDLPEDVSAAYVTSNAFSFFGIPAFLGRGIQTSDVPDSDQPTNVVVLSHKFWKQKYNGDKTIVGQTLQLNHEDYTIVGVMPSRFTFPTDTVGNADVYIPWAPARAPVLIPWIKLKPGVSLAVANEEFQSFLNQFKLETPKRFPDSFRVNVQPIIKPYVHRTGHTIALLFASVILLLLIGCANCSVLLLARGETRHHELAIRSAIGASRFRMVRQLLIESFAISFAGAAMGIAASFWLAELPLRLMPNTFPHEASITINFPILGFSIGLALIAGLLSGLFPALRLSRPNVSQLIQNTARAAGGTSKRTTNLLIGSQIALTFVLLGVAGAAIAGFVKITSMRLGYDPHNVMAIRVPLKRDADKDQQRRANYIEQLREHISTIPGVVSVAVASNLIPPVQPFGGVGTLQPFEILGKQPQQQQQAVAALVSPEYFSTLKIPVLRGRLWNTIENQRGDFVAVINQTLARHYWPNGDAIGHQIRVASLKNDGSTLLATSPQSGELRQIIGVVADSRNNGLGRPIAPSIYVPYTTYMSDGTELFVRTAGAPLAFVHTIRVALQFVNPDQRISQVDDLEEVLQHQPIWAQQRLFSILFSFFACLALILSLVGIASTVSFAAARRTNELGIRMALGAHRANIVWIVIKSTLATVASGIVVGLLLNFAVEKVLLYWTPGSVFAPWMVAGVMLLLLICATIACLLPARRAANIDPMQALRCE